MSLWKTEQFRTNDDKKVQEGQIINEITTLEHIKRIETIQSHIEQTIHLTQDPVNF